MASELIAFVLLFALGISMIAGINLVANSMTGAIEQSTAQIQLKNILEKLSLQLLETTESPAHTSMSYTIYQTFSLPATLSQQYTYTISTNQSLSGNYNLNGFLVKGIQPITTIVYLTSLLNVTYSLSGSFNSLSQNHQVGMVYQKGKWTVTLADVS